MNRGGFDHDLLDIAIRESIVWRVALSAARLWSQAWPSSAAGAPIAGALTAWHRLTPTQRIRAVCLTGMCAMVGDRLMALAGPSEPLGAVVPSLVFVACATIAVCAGPIARASERLRR